MKTQKLALLLSLQRKHNDNSFPQSNLLLQNSDLLVVHHYRHQLFFESIWRKLSTVLLSCYIISNFCTIIWPIHISSLLPLARVLSILFLSETEQITTAHVNATTSVFKLLSAES